MNPSQDSARSGNPSRVHDTLRRMVRWSWLRLTGEDADVVRGHFLTLARLNECHCRFLDTLAADHPELQPRIAAHQQERLAATTPNMDAQGKAK